MLQEISLEDLIRLNRCIETHFGQLHENDVLVSGETDEENKRFMDMYGKIMNYYYKNPNFDGMDTSNQFINSQDMAIHHIKAEIKKRIAPFRCS